MFERCCDERERAEKAGEFLYLRDYDGWVFVEGPRRSMTIKAAYYLGQRDGMNHTGEFYAWLDCPFCGAVLPLPADKETWRPDGDGDPN